MKVIDKNTGKIYNSIAQACRECEWIKCHKRTLQKHIKRDGCFNSIYPYISENMETESTSAKNAPVHRIHEVYTEEELDNLVALKEKAQDIELFTITPREKTKTKRVAISLLSDVHADEVVRKESCAGLNSYDQKIAKIRISNYFEGLVRMINRNKSDELILAVLGDLLGGFLHEELIQNNSCTPMQCVQMLKSCLVSGITHLLEQAPVDKITIIGICGNHSRTTRKKNYSNGFAMSYEYFLYKDVEAYFYGNDKLSFIIPESEMAFVNVMGRNILFMHGDQVKYQGGVAGIWAPLLRWFGKINNAFKVDMLCLGHFHSTNYSDKIVTNGSLVGYNSYAMSHALPFEEPQQSFFILDQKHGVRMFAPIYCK